MLSKCDKVKGEKHSKVVLVIFPSSFVGNKLLNSTSGISNMDSPNEVLAFQPPLQVILFSIQNHPLEKNEGLPSCYRLDTSAAYRPEGGLFLYPLFLLINPTQVRIFQCLLNRKLLLGSIPFRLP